MLVHYFFLTAHFFGVENVETLTWKETKKEELVQICLENVSSLEVEVSNWLNLLEQYRTNLKI